MAPSLRGLLLLLATLPLLYAIPTGEFQNPFFHEPIGCRQSPARTIFQRVRNSIIEKIWNIPSKSTCHGSGTKSEYVAPADFRTKYGGDAVLRFNITTEDEAKAFAEAVDTLYLDIWDTTSEWIDVRIGKEMLPSLLGLLPQSLQHSHTPLIHDLAQAVYNTYPAHSSHRNAENMWSTRHHSSTVRKHHHDLFFMDYQPLSVIYPWLNLVAALFPQVVETFSIGKSAEGRDIPAIRVGAPLSEQAPEDRVRARQAVLVVGGSHAREWISVSTATYMAYSLATRYGEPHHATVTKFLQHYDVYFVPVLNPDGYEYTWGTDRLWRKNRQTTSLPFCPGIDLDRSFGHHWDGEADKDNPCTDDYAGEFPFHATESKVLVDWVVDKTKNDRTVFLTYLDLHSYSQKVLYPYGFSCTAEPASLENLEEIAMGLAKSFRLVTGEIYDVDSACHSLLSTTTTTTTTTSETDTETDTNSGGGSSLDYFYDVLHVKHAFQIKLRDTGTYGFLLPSEDIVPSGKEMFGALVNYGRWLLGNRGIEIVVEDDNDLDGVVFDGVVEKEKEREKSGGVHMSATTTTSSSVNDKDNNSSDDDDDEEWERVYDEELRRKRR